MMRELLKVLPDLPADGTVASFLAETDCVTRTLKAYSDTLDGRLEAANQCTIQTAQVLASSSLLLHTYDALLWLVCPIIHKLISRSGRI